MFGHHDLALVPVRLDRMILRQPVALLEYLIRTYTDEGDIVLDFAMGSGSTAVACRNTGRRFIGVEIDLGIFQTALNRITHG
jgi:site-specific DNA-methyltransferase (adenine-specific)